MHLFYFNFVHTFLQLPFVLIDNSPLSRYYDYIFCDWRLNIIATQLGPDYVNNNIYPNMNDLANKMLAEHKK